MPIYPPSEDSFLLQKYVREYAQGRVLDLGTGAGILAMTALPSSLVREIVAVDINPEAIRALQEKVNEERIRKLTPLHSDLFSAVQGSFEVILCNPPYLPKEKGTLKNIQDDALYGGKKGWEFTERFFHEVSRYLFPSGKILYLFSSLTDKEKVEEIMRNHLFSFQELERKKLAFEELYVYLIEKTPLLQELERKGIEEICYFTHGKRGDIFRGIFDTNKFVKKYFSREKEKIIPVAIKIERKESKAEERSANEAQWLQILNTKGIGPRFLFSGNTYLVYRFVEGTPLMQWMHYAEKKEIVAVLQEALRQCFILDQVGVNKEEMHRPIKHILVDKDHYPWMIDFERCNSTKKPKNVTQFLEFLRRISPELEKKGVKRVPQDLTILAQKYKKEHAQEAFREIIAFLQ